MLENPGAESSSNGAAPGNRRPEEEPVAVDDGQVEYLAIAQFLAPRGLRGEIKAEILTDFPARFAQLRTVYVGRARTPYQVEQAQLHKGQVILKLAGVDTLEQAEKLRGEMAFVPVAEAVALAEGQYFWHQIIGLAVDTAEGQRLGRIVDIIPTGSNDVYVVRAQGREILIPAIEDVVKEIDLARGRMVVAPLPGMLD